MASESFLSGLAGLVEGVGAGVERQRARKDVEAERAFRLRQYETEQRRAAVLDALNEDVARGRLAIEQRNLKLEEDRAQQEEENLTEIPYNIGGQTFNVPRSMAKQLEMLSAQQAILSQSMTDAQVGGDTFKVSPEEAARFKAEDVEAGERRKMEIKRMLADRYDAIRQGNPTISDDEALAQTIKFGKMLFPDEFVDVMPEDYMPATEEAAPAVSASERPGGGLLDRLGLAARGMNPFAKDPVEALRARMFGSKPPQSLRELESARQAESQAEAGRSNRLLMLARQRVFPEG